ncbi:PD40 domain-containing protein [Pedobacter sp. Hv1]|uniref:PD40 domain-containing protein n=1 Tax=Pedobacter sp. Hv1 TaxID=1740090 RepID=UPI0006D8AD13|nr:PD40 domain-containing protein [Pedobacter sp. Hv1]KQB99261.1 hypothetical protein AQF98_16940 [Pedobacter sp. Hv1]
MKKIICCFLLAPLFVQAQQIQFANKVLKYSSDLGGKLNSVKRILGKPDAFPQGGTSANAWVAKDALGSAYVEVEFEQAQTVKQIAVFENLNAGCITKIMVGDAAGKLHTVNRKQGSFIRWMNSLQSKGNPDRAYYFNRKRRKIEVAPNVESNADIAYFFLQAPEEKVKIVRVEFDFSLKPGQKQIDAIAISDSEEPIQPQLNLMDGADQLPAAEKFIYAPDIDYDLSSIFVIEKDLFYTISKYQTAGEIHAVDLTNPKEIIDVTKKIKNDKKLNYILGHAAASKTILMGSENKFRRDGDALGFDFFNLNEGVFTYQKPLKIIAYNNYGDYADAFWAKDGQHLIFGIESDLTQGGYDLYFTQPKDEESFGLLQNMGKGLNTAADETNPFMLSDNKTLIFASNGYSGYGDFDLYVSTRLDDTWKNWSTPKNLGPKVNGQSFETNPFYEEKTEMLYYVSFRDGVSVIQKIKIPMGQLTTASQ